MTAGSRRLRRLPTLVGSVLVVVAVAAVAMLTVGAANPAVAFQQTGHWVFNRAENSAVHVDSGTRAVDARVAVPGAPQNPVFTLQGQRQGFLVGRQALTVFGKSTLTVESSLPTGQTELPIGIETVGGPYLVYRQAGTIVRLGLPPLSIQVGAPVDRPISTDDGTVWLRRPDNGAICALRHEATAVDCASQTAPGATGALAVLGDVPTFVDTSRDAAQAVARDTGPVALGTDLPDTALIGDRDTHGRLPVVLLAPNRLLLADTGGVAEARAGGAPVSVALGDGTFSSPIAADGVVAVLEQTHNRLQTFAVDGRLLATFDLPADAGPSLMTRGADGHIYIDDADGAATDIVGADGTVTSIKTGAPRTAVSAPAPDAAVLVPPPPQVPSPPRGPTIPGDQTPNPSGGGGSDGSGDKPPPTPIPGAPTDVRAQAQAGGAVTVSWTAPDPGGPGLQYTVTGSDGSTHNSTARSVRLTDLTPGQQYTFTVTATNAAGPGPASEPSNPVTVAVGPPGAPTDINLSQRGEGARSVIVTLTWGRPELNGGELVDYIITATDGNGKQVLNTTSTTESIPRDFHDSCLEPYTYVVRAVTRTPGGAGTQTGPAATAKTSDRDCSINMTISAATQGPTAAAVSLTESAPFLPYVSHPCSLSFNGDVKWTGTCGGASHHDTSLTVTGLDPGTQYEIVLTTKQFTGDPTESNTVTVTTPAGQVIPGGATSTPSNTNGN